MAGIPPPPTKAENGSFAWVDWYNKLQRFLSNGQSIPWSTLDKAGSKLSDLETRDHSMLTNVQGGALGEQYHLTAAQYAALGGTYVLSFNTRTGAVTLTSADVTTALGYTPANRAFTSQAADPTTANIPAGTYAMYKNTTTNLLKLWANDGGTLKSVTLT